MNLPKPTEIYEMRDQVQLRGILEREDKRNVKIGGDLIVTASDGSRWKLVADASGNLATLAI